MSTIELGIILVSLFAVTASFIYVAFKLGPKNSSDLTKNVLDGADKDIEHIFNDEFREELRNRGRLHFEKIIGENAMFLQQDLQLTTSQLNDFMKSEITSKLTAEFARYEQSIDDAKKLAVESIAKTRTAIEDQRKVMSEQLTKEISEEKQRIIARFEENMATIINHYVMDTIGTQIDLNDQLNFIITELEANKKDIIADIKNGS